MADTDVIDQLILRYIEAARSLWNTYFLSPGAADDTVDDMLRRFTPIRRQLFDALVMAPLGREDDRESEEDPIRATNRVLLALAIVLSTERRHDERVEQLPPNGRKPAEHVVHRVVGGARAEEVGVPERPCRFDVPQDQLVDDVGVSHGAILRCVLPPSPFVISRSIRSCPTPCP